VGEDVFRLGALLTALALGRHASPAWRLDGPPRADLSTVKRRAVLAALASPRPGDRYPTAAAALAAFESALATGVTVAPAWPMFRGDAGRTGAAQATAEAIGMDHRWHARVGAIAASPIIAGDLVIAPTSDGRLVFLDRGTGRVLEEIRVGTAVESSPCVAEGVVHVGTDDGMVVGIGLVDGRERYRTKVGGMVRSSPLAANGLVIVGTVEARGQGGLVALDEGGRPRWTRKLASVFSSPTLAGDAVMVGADDGAVHAFEAATGAPRWSRKIAAKVRATPAVQGPTVFVAGFDGTFVSLRAADGVPIWERAIGHSVYSSPCLLSGAVVFGCHDGHVHGVDLATGELRFQAETRGPVLASPVAIGTRVVVSSTDGRVYVVDATGGVVSRTPLPGGASQSSPAVDGPDLFIGGVTGLHALGLLH
jgi:outer membrane protein assembly factor BamB